MAWIPTTVITGFLGTGKTTLVRLQNAGGRPRSNSAGDRLRALSLREPA